MVFCVFLAKDRLYFRKRAGPAGAATTFLWFPEVVILKCIFRNTRVKDAQLSWAEESKAFKELCTGKGHIVHCVVRLRHDIIN